jgi:hypothetical protein
MELGIDRIDLEALTRLLRRRLGREMEASYLRGRTILRDAVVEGLGCSECEAEELVETLELRGFVRFPVLYDETHPSGRAAWRIG